MDPEIIKKFTSQPLTTPLDVAQVFKKFKTPDITIPLSPAKEPEAQEKRMDYSILDLAKDIREERQDHWGETIETHQRIAQGWSAVLHEVLNRPLTAHEVALCMTILKAIRASINPDDPDSYVDGAAYLSIAWDCEVEESSHL